MKVKKTVYFRLFLLIVIIGLAINIAMSFYNNKKLNKKLNKIISTAHTVINQKEKENTLVNNLEKLKKVNRDLFIRKISYKYFRVEIKSKYKVSSYILSYIYHVLVYKTFSQINEIRVKNYLKLLSLDDILLLYCGLVDTESTWNFKARSTKGAYGLMMVRYVTWKETYKIRNYEKLFEWRFNLNTGTEIFLGYLEDSNGNLNQALLLYNNGYKHKNLKYPDKVYSSIKNYKILFKEVFDGKVHVQNWEEYFNKNK